jgi:hypothetical protein
MKWPFSFLPLVFACEISANWTSLCLGVWLHTQSSSLTLSETEFEFEIADVFRKRSFVRRRRNRGGTPFVDNDNDGVEFGRSRWFELQSEIWFFLLNLVLELESEMLPCIWICEYEMFFIFFIVIIVVIFKLYLNYILFEYFC